VRSVAVIVQILGRNEALAIHDSRRQIGMVENTAIDDRYPDAASRITQLVGNIGTGGCRGKIECTEYLAILREASRQRQG